MANTAAGTTDGTAHEAHTELANGGGSGSAAPHAGRAIAESLVRHGVDRVFTVPGESYLAVLDGLYDTDIRNVVCRHEGGAAYMADAYGRSSGAVGVAMVTRGPGAANALVAVHTAWQDASPLVLFVGLVPVGDRDREAFQEFDPRAWFGSQAKRVLVLDAPDRASEVVAEAFHAAVSGRPGPVIVGLPEDVVAAEFSGELRDPIPLPESAVPAADRAAIAEMLGEAERPLLLIGGEGWGAQAAASTVAFAERNDLPVLQDWHAAGRVPTGSAVYVGQSAFGGPEHAVRALAEADLVVTIGTVLGDTVTDSFRVPRAPGSRTVVISPDAALRGHAGTVTRHVLATPAACAEALGTLTLARTESRAESRSEWLRTLRDAHLATLDVATPPPSDAHASMTRVIREVAARVSDPIVTLGAGNHGAWAALLETRSFPAELGPRNGSMGYSIPAGVAAALAHPERPVIALAGDGEFLMNGQELATAAQEGAAPLVVVMDNRQFGTIRVHQEREYPGRVSGTQVASPDFALLAAGYGGHGETVSRDADAPAAVERALAAVAAGRFALLHVVVDPAVLLP